jgi:type IV secretory pathway TrbD component
VAEPGIDVPQPGPLRRRVLLTGLLTLALFLVLAYVVTALEASGVWLLVGMVVVWAVVVRPLMAPVRSASQLRRRLAYQAFLEERSDRSGGQSDG